MAKPTQRSVSVERLIAAPAENIFAVLTDPSRHCEIDGSGTLARLTTSNAPLTLGSTFSMRIKVGLSYTVKNRVLEFEENRLITWAHWQGQRWSYPARAPTRRGHAGTRNLRLVHGKAAAKRRAHRAHRKNVPNMQKTLERLAALVETPDDD